MKPEEYNDLLESACILIDEYIHSNINQYIQPNFHDVVRKNVVGLLADTICASRADTICASREDEECLINQAVDEAFGIFYKFLIVIYI